MVCVYSFQRRSERPSIGPTRLASPRFAQEPTDFFDRFDEAAPPYRRVHRKGGKKPRWRSRFQDHEATTILLGADQAAECLLELEAGQLFVERPSETRAPRLVKDCGLRPRHLVEHGEPEAATRHVDSVAQRIGAKQAGVLLATEKIDEGPGIEAIHVLRVKGNPGIRERTCDATLHGAQGPDGRKKPEGSAAACQKQFAKGRGELIEIASLDVANDEDARLLVVAA